MVKELVNGARVLASTQINDKYSTYQIRTFSNLFIKSIEYTFTCTVWNKNDLTVDRLWKCTEEYNSPGG